MNLLAHYHYNLFTTTQTAQPLLCAAFSFSAAPTCTSAKGLFCRITLFHRCVLKRHWQLCRLAGLFECVVVCVCTLLVCNSICRTCQGVCWRFAWILSVSFPDDAWTPLNVKYAVRTFVHEGLQLMKLFLVAFVNCIHVHVLLLMLYLVLLCFEVTASHKRILVLSCFSWSDHTFKTTLRGDAAFTQWQWGGKWLLMF